MRHTKPQRPTVRPIMPGLLATSLTMLSLAGCESAQMEELSSPVQLDQSETAKTTICHRGRQTITVALSALRAHLAHGDTLGPCTDGGIEEDGGLEPDSGLPDAGVGDAGPVDGGAVDSGGVDAGAVDGSAGDGAIDVTVGFNICPKIVWYQAAPLLVRVGGFVYLEAEAVDADGDALTVLWSSSTGEFTPAGALNTRYLCTSAGEKELRLSVADPTCEDIVQFPIRCTP